MSFLRAQKVLKYEFDVEVIITFVNNIKKRIKWYIHFIEKPIIWFATILPKGIEWYIHFISKPLI